MHKYISIIVSLLLAVSVASAAAAGPVPVARKITVEIDYGHGRPARMVETVWHGGETALEALQAVAAVETRPVAGLLFVTAIDSVQGQRGKTAWYYRLDGKPAKQLAGRQELADVSRLSWVYQEDVCSRTVDK